VTTATHPLAPDLRPITERDVAGLILALVIVVLPHATRAPWWVTGAALALYAWRARLAATRMQPPSPWLLTICSQPRSRSARRLLNSSRPVVSSIPSMRTSISVPGVGASRFSNS